jgi:hypothetical protein
MTLISGLASPVFGAADAIKAYRRRGGGSINGLILSKN